MRWVLAILLFGAALPIASCDDRRSTLPIAVARDRSMQVRDIKVGLGAPAGEGSNITVHYEGVFPDGTVFMSTRKQGKTHSWKIGDGTVIYGMDQGVRGMRKGGVRIIKLPPEMHWGNGGYGGVIPPDTWIEFKIEMLSVR
jgi:FKBP-type peptidyl-prolyl cis-trans isomerase